MSLEIPLVSQIRRDSLKEVWLLDSLFFDRYRVRNSSHIHRTTVQYSLFSLKNIQNWTPVYAWTSTVPTVPVSKDKNEHYGRLYK
jgi:hypothetical protein